MLYQFSAYYKVKGKKRGRQRDIHVEQHTLFIADHEALSAAIQTTQPDELLVSLVHIVKEGE